MALKIVSSIKDAEASARETIENQKKQNQTDIDEARTSVKEKLKNANAAKQRSILDARDKADADADKQIESLREEYDQKIAVLSDIAEKNLTESVKFIISKI